MVQLILIMETILILFWIDIEYHTHDNNYKPILDVHYSSQNTFDVVGNPILILKDIPENQKLIMWKASNIKYEMLSHFPNFQLMEMFFNDRIEDNGRFKTDFLNHMREVHGEYIGAIISKEEFIKALINPPSF